MRLSCGNRLLALLQNQVSNLPAPRRSVLATCRRNQDQGLAPTFELTTEALDLFAAMALLAAL